MTIIVHHLNHSRSQRILWLLEELNVPYEIRHYARDAVTNLAPEALTNIHPLGKSPLIEDDGTVIFESGAILQYLGRKFGRFYAADERRRAEIEQWLFWQVGGLGPMAGQAHHFRQYAPDPINYAIERYTREVERLYGVLERRLADRDYLAGEYSIADIACVGWIVPHEKQGQDLIHFPRLKRWFDTVMARPAVVRGMAVGRQERERTNFAQIPVR